MKIEISFHHTALRPYVYTHTHAHTLFVPPYPRPSTRTSRVIYLYTARLHQTSPKQPLLPFATWYPYIDTDTFVSARSASPTPIFILTDLSTQWYIVLYLRLQVGSGSSSPVGANHPRRSDDGRGQPHARGGPSADPRPVLPGGERNGGGYIYTHTLYYTANSLLINQPLSLYRTDRILLIRLIRLSKIYVSTLGITRVEVARSPETDTWHCKSKLRLHSQWLRCGSLGFRPACRLMKKVSRLW